MAATLVLIASPRAQAATPAEIDAAIEKAVAFLYSQQQPPGNWEHDLQRRGSEHDIGGMQGDTFGGYTALATYALLAADEKPQDPRILKAIHFLQTADIIGIYALGLRANVWALLPPAISKKFSERDARLITAGIQNGQLNPDTRGFWEYGNGKGPGLTGSRRFDHSVSQYGVLGLWACAENDVNVDRVVWELIDAGWKSHQFPDGGWSYDSMPAQGREETPSMTAAGVATLFITDEMINTNRGIDCKGNIVNVNIDRGMEWMTSHFKQVDNTYAWYGIERIGAASGRKYFGATDWFTQGAEKIVRSQQANGSWIGGFPGAENNAVPPTAFALLFLTRGRAPVMMNKLQYVASSTSGVLLDGNWDQRPRDVANLVHWTGKQLELHLNWQIVNLSAPVDDLHDAPILYLSGDQEIQFTPEDEAKLREFVETGGMILANADCGKSKSAFAYGFEALGKRLFPRYEFRTLRSDHPIYTDQPYHQWPGLAPPRLRGLSNGVRELMVLIPDFDPARAWQIRTDHAQISAFQLGADIFLYAVDKQNLNNRGETYIIQPDENIIAQRSAKVARLVIGNNFDPEPGGWRRLAALIHNQYKLDIDVINLKLGDKKLALCKLAHLTGTGHFSLKPLERQQLIDYVTHGGTLVIDAAGGNTDFADSAALELRSCFGPQVDEALKTPLDPYSQVFQLLNNPIGAVSYRDLYRRQVVGRLKTPRLCCITINNRLAVFFSREDLTAGLVGEPVGGIAGYTPQSATEIMRNIVLYSAFGFRAEGVR